MSIEANASRGFLAALLVAVAGGCATDSGGRGSDGGGEPPACHGPGFASDGTPETPFASLSATVVDESGAPVPDLRAQACGLDVCLNGATNASGRVTIEKQDALQKPAFKYGDGRTHAKFAYLLDTSSTIQVDLGEEPTVTLPAIGTGDELSAGATVASGGVELELHADLAPVEPDPFDFDTPELRRFRAALVPDGMAVRAVDPTLGLEILVALTPSGTVLCPAGGLSVPNGPGWDPGSPVEFFLHGLEIEEEWAPYGGWQKVSDGVVTADGARVETAPGGGIPILSVVGVRLAR